jgi:glyoxylase-like metal-dependent hydrolase (beta-lactamase superfamily II)
LFETSGEQGGVVGKIRFSSVNGNMMGLDGGAMFGNAPKALWQRWTRADDNNMIDIASRCLLVETDTARILFETGVGAYLSPAMKQRFGVKGETHQLLDSLNDLALDHGDITHVVLSHLHFDHAGGLLATWQEGREAELLFPNAEFITGRANWERSCSPHIRDRASFIPELNRLLEESNRLCLKDNGDILNIDGVNIRFIESNGHTPGMMLSHISCDDGSLVFAGDIAPGHFWVNLPITMGYDRFPEELINEKTRVFKEVCEENAWVFYTHDPVYSVSKLAVDPKNGRFVPTGLEEAFTRKTLGRS